MRKYLIASFALLALFGLPACGSESKPSKDAVIQATEDPFKDEMIGVTSKVAKDIAATFGVELTPLVNGRPYSLSGEYGFSDEYTAQTSGSLQISMHHGNSLDGYWSKAVQLGTLTSNVGGHKGVDGVIDVENGPMPTIELRTLAGDGQPYVLIIQGNWPEFLKAKMATIQKAAAGHLAAVRKK